MLSENVALTLLIKILGPSIGKTILASLSGENIFLETTGGEIIDSINEKIEPYSQSEKKIVEDLARRIFDQTKSLFEAEGINLDQGGVFSVKVAFAQVLANAEITPDMLVSQDLSSSALENYLKQLSSTEMRDFGIDEQTLYDRLIKSFSEQIVAEISQHKNFITYISSDTLSSQKETLSGLEHIKVQGNAQERVLDRNSKQQIETQAQALHTNRQLEEIKSLLSSNPIEDIDDLLNEASGRNPGLSFQLLNNPPNPPTIIVSATTLGNPVSFSKLAFPDTESGQRGLRKFKSLVEEGHQASFEEGEFEWNWQFEMPKFVGPSPTLTEFHLSKNLPNTDIPVKLEIFDGNDTLYEISYAKLKVIRAGTKEVEFSLSSAVIPVSINLVVKDSHNSSFVVDNIDFSKIELIQAKKLIEFRLATLKMHKVRMSSLELNIPIFEAEVSQPKESFESIDRLECIHQFAIWLVVINKRLGLNLRVPEEINIDDFETAQEIFEAVTKGFHIRGSSKLTLRYDREKAIELLNNWDSAKKANPVFGYHDYGGEFLGESIHLGSVEITLSELSLIHDLESLLVHVNESAKEEIEIQIRCSKSLYRFTQYLSGEQDQALTDIQQGLDEVNVGQTRPVEDFAQEMQQKYDISS